MLLAVVIGGSVGLGTAVGAWRWRRLVRKPAVYASADPALHAVLSKLPALQEPLVPPFWCFSWWAQLAALVKLRSVLHARSVEFDVESVPLDDGGECGLAWALPSADMKPLPPTAPILCVFHTITATIEDPQLHLLCSHAMVRGMRPVVLLRRGHLGRPLLTAKFHILGFADDCRAQLRKIQLKFCDASLVALGSSAGTGLLVRTAGEDGHDSPFHAAVCICPGFDTGHGQFGKKIDPLVAPYMRKMVSQFFLEGIHAAVLTASAIRESRIDESLRSAKAATDFESFYEALSGLAGYDSVDEMNLATNPMLTARGIKKLGLVISALDDPICTMAPEYIGDTLFDGGSDPRALVLTSTGTHCAFFDGWSGMRIFTGQETWAERLGLDFLQVSLGERQSN